MREEDVEKQDERQLVEFIAIASGSLVICDIKFS